MDWILRQYLWRGNSDTPKQSLAAWEMLCKPKASGGVGILNFPNQNEALLLQHMDTFYNLADIPWVKLVWSSHYEGVVPHAENLCGSFWWRDIMKLVEKYRMTSSVLPRKGTSFLFWEDSWLFCGSNQPLSVRYPTLYSYVIDTKISAAEFYEQEDVLSSICLCRHGLVRS